MFILFGVLPIGQGVQVNWQRAWPLRFIVVAAWWTVVGSGLWVVFRLRVTNTRVTIRRIYDRDD